MSKKTSRARLRVSEIAISDHARVRLKAAGPGALTRYARHLQSEWEHVPRLPGHVVYLDLVTRDITLVAILGLEGAVRAVIVTPVEAAIMRARIVDPAAPGTVSPFRKVSLDDDAPIAESPGG